MFSNSEQGLFFALHPIISIKKGYSKNSLLIKDNNTTSHYNPVDHPAAHEGAAAPFPAPVLFPSVKYTADPE